MPNTTLSSKGQVVIPRDVRQRFGWLPGTVFEIEIESQGKCLVLRPIPELPRTTLADLIGCAGYEGAAKTLEEMTEGIARGADASR